MSRIPPPIDPLGYSTPLPPRRPTSVTVIAIIAIIWGSIAVLGGLCAFPQYLGVQFSPNPVTGAMSKDTVLRTFNLVAMGIGMVLAILQIAGGIAALSLKPSGRRMLIWYAIVQIAITVVSLPLQWAVIYPRMVQVVGAKVAANSPVMTGMKIGFFIGLGVALLSLIWPALVLYFMNRPRVKTAFEEGM